MLNKPSPRLAILRAQAAAQAEEDAAYKARCTAFESGDHALPFDFSAGFSKEVVGGFVFCAESGVYSWPIAAEVPIKISDTWHSEPPPVPGVYVASITKIAGEDFWRHWDGKAWSVPVNSGDDVGPSSLRRTTSKDVMWLRLVSPDPAPATTKTTDWRRGSDIPQAERTGLWHVAGARSVSTATRAFDCRFSATFQYRPAAPGVSEGDPYDESRYATQERYFVCVESYTGSEVGDVLHGSKFIFKHEPDTRYWLPCDKDGWITHTPTPTSTCPVPGGLRAGIRFDQGREWLDTDPTTWKWSSDQSSRIVAWRPVRGAA